MFSPLSQQKRKAISGLRKARERRELMTFVVEGGRAVEELAAIFRCQTLVATSRWLEAADADGRLAKITRNGAAEVFVATRADMERITSLSTAPEVVALFPIEERRLDLDSLRGKLTVALDCVQDPGNLGTIIRTCDWFGVDTLLCSTDTVDIYNPKAIQSTMGSIGNVAVHYVDLPQVLTDMRARGMKIFGTFLDGGDIYSARLGGEGIIVMGNEGNGVSEEVASLVTDRLYIPSFAQGRTHVESLNVGIATAVTLSCFRESTHNVSLKG